MASLSDIIKTYELTHGDYKATITKNGRGDHFLEINKVTNLASYERPKVLMAPNVIGVTLFLTLKSAKNKAIEIINEISK